MEMLEERYDQEVTMSEILGIKTECEELEDADSKIQESIDHTIEEKK